MFKRRIKSKEKPQQSRKWNSERFPAKWNWFPVSLWVEHLKGNVSARGDAGSDSALCVSNDLVF